MHFFESAKRAQKIFVSAKRALLIFESASESAAHNFGKERRVSGAHRNDERTHALIILINIKWVGGVLYLQS